MQINEIIKLLLIGVGGFVGAVSRHALATYVHYLFGEAKFPIGIMIVNMIGCFLIGLLAGIVEAKDLFTENYRLMIFSGLLGAFTTFSTFSKNTYDLFVSGHITHALLNIAISVVLGLFAVWLGIFISTKF